jgi:glyoxylase-like metal-dependent hydrolase (beta-lactamase superfamily II)
MFAKTILFALMMAASAAEAAPAVKLYVLDCGRIVFKDMGLFSDTGELDHVPGTMVDPCFLIQHPNGSMVWDTGLGDAIAEHKDGVDNNGIRLFVDTPMQTQLRALGVKPQDIKFLAFSHFHFDHTGNAGLFTSATWILNKAELTAMTGPEPPFGVDPARLAAYKNVRQEIITGDHDVFGDGSVRIFRAIGHTPGHQVLMIHLARAGNVILAGDLYHTQENRKHRRVPGINTDRADTLASMDRVEHLAETMHARLIIQHNPQDIQSLPKFPAFLE